MENPFLRVGEKLKPLIESTVFLWVLFRFSFLFFSNKMATLSSDDIIQAFLSQMRDEILVGNLANYRNNLTQLMEFITNTIPLLPVSVQIPNVHIEEAPAAPAPAPPAPAAPAPAAPAPAAPAPGNYLSELQRQTALSRIPNGSLTIYAKQKGQTRTVHTGVYNCRTKKVTAINNGIIYPTINMFAKQEAGQRVDVWIHSYAVYVENGQSLDNYLRQFL